MNPQLIARATLLRNELVRRQQRLVLTESCTGGWLAASLASLPGISQWWCGSLVVYRCGSKQQWLGVDASLLNDPEVGPVSEQVTVELARRALVLTSEADLSLAVTGDLGPGVAAEKDGRVYCVLADRNRTEEFRSQTQLQEPAPLDASDVTARVARLEEASLWVLERCIRWLE